MRFRRAWMGCAVALAMLLALEGALRVLSEPAEPQPMVRPRWEPGPAPFVQRRSHVFPRYQGVDAIGPFRARPKTGVARIMAFGGSSVRGGSRLPPKHEFPGELGDRLKGAVEVVNLARPGLDSHQLRPLLEQALQFQPALVLLYMGHNDLGNVVQEARFGSPAEALALRLRLLLGHLRLYSLLKRQILSAPGARLVGVVAPGARFIPADDPIRARVAAELEQNLLAMVQAIQAAGAQALLVTPISDWVSAAPLGRGCAEIVTETEAQLERALLAHPECPELRFQRGRLRLQRDEEGAYADLRAALEADPLPLRATRIMTDAVRSAAQRSGARLLDLEAEVEAAFGAPPPQWFRDGVHFTAAGHREVSRRLAPEVLELLEIDGGER